MYVFLFSEWAFVRGFIQNLVSTTFLVLLQTNEVEKKHLPRCTDTNTISNRKQMTKVIHEGETGGFPAALLPQPHFSECG